MSDGQPALTAVLGGGVLKADEYADFLAREYLSGYLRAGGAAVKVAVMGDGGAADRLEAALATATAEHGGLRDDSVRDDSVSDDTDLGHTDFGHTDFEADSRSHEDAREA